MMVPLIEKEQISDARLEKHKVMYTYVAGLLLTLAKVTQTACTSQVCLWCRPRGKSSKGQLSADVDVDLASSTGYQPYCGAVLDALAVEQEVQVSAPAVGCGDFIEMEHGTSCTRHILHVVMPQCSTGLTPALGCSETLAHNETDFSRRFRNLQLPSSLIDKNNKHYCINTNADRW